MGAPIFIDSIVLTLGRFLRNREQERNVPVGRIETGSSDRVSTSTVITLSSGQMLLPGIGVTHRFIQ
jgi:hypothetical protein